MVPKLGKVGVAQLGLVFGVPMPKVTPEWLEGAKYRTYVRERSLDTGSERHAARGNVIAEGLEIRRVPFPVRAEAEVTKGPEFGNLTSAHHIL